MAIKKLQSKKWLSYKITFAVLILGSLLAVYVYHMITQTWLRNIEYPFNYALFQWQFISFFTYQSNFIVGMWFLLSTIYHNKPNKVMDNQNLRISVTCYITVTMIIWTFFLLPGMFVTDTKVTYIGAIQGIAFHIIFPISLIIYTCYHMEPLTKSLGRYYLSTFWSYWLYPICYSIMIVTGFYLLIGDNPDIPLQIAFPYAPFFLNNESPTDIIANTFDTFILMFFMFFVVHFFFIIVNLFYVLLIRNKTKKHKK